MLNFFGTCIKEKSLQRNTCGDFRAIYDVVMLLFKRSLFLPFVYSSDICLFILCLL